MTLKKLFVLGSVIAGASYLRDKTRRDRALRGANDLFSNIKNRAQAMGVNIPGLKGNEPAGVEQGTEFGGQSAGYGSDLGTTQSGYTGGTTGRGNGLY